MSGVAHAYAVALKKRLSDAGAIIPPMTRSVYRTPSPNVARRHVGCAPRGSELWFFGGEATGGASGALKILEVYDTKTDTWTRKADMPESRTNIQNGGAWIGDTLYVLGGATASGVGTRTLWAYSSNSDSWTIKADIPATGGTYDDAMVVAWEGNLYATKAYYGNLIARYTPDTNSWSSFSLTTALPYTRRQARFIDSDGKWWVASGINTPGDTTTWFGYVDLSLSAPTYVSRKSMPSPGSAGGVLGRTPNGKIYAGAGSNMGQSLFVYDIATDAWSTETLRFLTSRQGSGGGALIGLDLWAAFGFSGSLFNTIEKWNMGCLLEDDTGFNNLIRLLASED